MDIPIIVRSLADSLALADASVLPLSFEPDLLATLDIGVDDDSKCRRVSTYHRAWWLVRKPRNLDSVDIMDRSSIDKCLDVYRHLLLPSQRGEVVTSGSTSTGPSGLPVPPAPLLALSKPGCVQCGWYRDLLGGLLNELLDVRHFAAAMSTASENQWCLDMRRASTFNLLYEAAVIKECGPSTRAPRGNKAERAKAVEDRAREELMRLQALPPSSHKWTWGEQLTEKDVLGLARSGTRPGKIHSGYDVSLKGGKNSGEDSFTPSLPTSHGRFEDVPEDLHTSLPDATLAGPSYFSNFRHRLYDPLSLKVLEGDSVSPSAYRRRGLLAGISEGETLAPGPAPGMPPAPSPLSNIPSSASPFHAIPALAMPLDPAPAMPSELEPTLGSVPILADDWSSSSDKEDVVESAPPAPALPSEPAPTLSTVPILADDWSSGSDEEDVVGSAPGLAPGPAPAMPPLSILADDWLSGSDKEEGEGGLAEEWTSASGDKSEGNPAGSGSESSNEGSPSHITLNVQSDIPPLVLDVVPLYSDDFRVITRSYGPQDFGHLADEMFEDSDTE